MSNIRYGDMGLSESGAGDFVSRQRAPSPVQLAIIFLSVLIIAVSVVLAVKDDVSLIVMLFIILGALGWYVIYHMIRSRDIVLATEFQNAIFASALGLNNKFNIIIKRDGVIVYLDRAFQTLFPDFTKQHHRTIDLLLSTAKVKKEDADKVYAALDKGEYGKVLLEIQDSNKRIHNIILSVEPILRPAGFIMLRGREYVPERSNNLHTDATSLSLHSNASISLFSPVIESMRMGILITSPEGTIVYCNSLLEEWLQYDDGEITDKNLELRRIFPSERNKGFNGPLSDFEGNVQLEKKVGGFLPGFLNQKIIYNDNRKPMGCTAIVHLLDESGTLAKKKSGNADGEQF